MIKVSKNVVLIDYIISAADTANLKPNVVLSLVEVCFSSLEKEKKKELANDLMKTLGLINEDAKKNGVLIYEKISLSSKFC